jgi:hypothetical protein
VLTVTPLDFGFWVEDWWVPGPSRGVGNSHVGGMVLPGFTEELFCLFFVPWDGKSCYAGTEDRVHCT